MKAFYILAISSLVGYTAVSCKKNNGCARSEKAVVKDFSDSDTCGIIFQLEDGTKLEPTNLAEFKGLPYNHNDKVWISYKPADGASKCGIGEIVKIRCVSAREY